jgi:CelD/BcsL family acetyltransferase involved in cellulose biosynthesis
MKPVVTDRQPSSSSAYNVRVITTDPQTDSRWAAFVLSHSNGSVYHHPAWLEALSKEYKQESMHLACESADGRFLAVMPLIYTRGLPFGLGGALTGSRLSSLPRTPLAGPLSNDQRATVAIIRAALEISRQRPDVRLQIKTHGSDLDGLVDGVLCSPWRNSYILTLPVNAGAPFRINDSQMRARVRWAVNKAAKLGVLVRPAATEGELREWYRLYLDTMRRNMVPPRAYRFFQALWSLLRPEGYMQLLIAEQSIGSHKTILAGSIFFMLGGTVSYAFNGSDRRYLSLRPNDAIQWQAINEACNSRRQFFDLGEVPEKHFELAHFKSKWGAKAIRMYRYRSSLPDEAESGSDYREGRIVSLAKKVWRQLPAKTTEHLGNRIYSYL